MATTNKARTRTEGTNEPLVEQPFIYLINRRVRLDELRARLTPLNRKD